MSLNEEKPKRGRPVQAKLRCQHCERNKARDKFYNDSGSPTGKSRVCIDCNTEYCMLRNYRRTLKTKGHGAIREMISVNKPVIFDCVVDPNENCFPMIPSGRAHNEMLLGDATVSVEDAITEEGKMMV